jgi:hypothetical protein
MQGRDDPHIAVVNFAETVMMSQYRTILLLCHNVRKHHKSTTSNSKLRLNNYHFNKDQSILNH